MPVENATKKRPFPETGRASNELKPERDEKAIDVSQPAVFQ